MRIKTGQAKIISPGDFRQLLKIVVAGNHGLRNKTILILSHYLGLRASEIAALNINDVMNEHGSIKSELSLLAAYTKGNIHRDIPLEHSKVKNALAEWINYRKCNEISFVTTSPLFKSQKNLRFSANSMVHTINKLYQENGYRGCSSHTGRRTLITRLAQKGVDLNSIRVIAGHKSITTTQRYIENDPNRLAEIMRNL